jgi:Cof subfamily protein (haloacid dehalogenase superfamily)
MDSKQKIRLLISDVDGTLLNSDGDLSPTNYVAIGRLHQAGIKFSLSSGRPSFGMKRLIRTLHVDCVCSGLNGAVLFNPDGSVLAEKSLDRGLVEELAKRMQKYGLDVWFYTRAQWYVPRLAGRQVNLNADAIGTSPQPYARLDDVSDPILKVAGRSDGQVDVSACEAELKEEFAGTVSVVRVEPRDLDVTHGAADKGQAALAIAVIEGAQMADVTTVGDSPADIPMFQESGLSIAMGQASDPVRHAATQVTRTNADNGLAWAIEYVLNGKWSSNGAR